MAGSIYDNFKLLDIPVTRDRALIKATYRSLALRYHPDKNKGKDSGIFGSIKEAYDDICLWLDKPTGFNETTTPLPEEIQKDKALQKFLWENNCSLDVSYFFSHELENKKSVWLDFLIEGDSKAADYIQHCGKFLRSTLRREDANALAISNESAAVAMIQSDLWSTYILSGSSDAVEAMLTTHKPAFIKMLSCPRLIPFLNPFQYHALFKHHNVAPGSVKAKDFQAENWDLFMALDCLWHHEGEDKTPLLDFVLEQLETIRQHKMPYDFEKYMLSIAQYYPALKEDVIFCQDDFFRLFHPLDILSVVYSEEHAMLACEAVLRQINHGLYQELLQRLSAQYRNVWAFVVVKFAPLVEGWSGKVLHRVIYSDMYQAHSIESYYANIGEHDADSPMASGGGMHCDTPDSCDTPVDLLSKQDRDRFGTLATRLKPRERRKLEQKASYFREIIHIFWRTDTAPKEATIPTLENLKMLFEYANLNFSEMFDILPLSENLTLHLLILLEHSKDIPFEARKLFELMSFVQPKTAAFLLRSRFFFGAVSMAIGGVQKDSSAYQQYLNALNINGIIFDEIISMEGANPNWLSLIQQQDIFNFIKKKPALLHAVYQTNLDLAQQFFCHRQQTPALAQANSSKGPVFSPKMVADVATQAISDGQIKLAAASISFPLPKSPTILHQYIELLEKLLEACSDIKNSDQLDASDWLILLKRLLEFLTVCHDIANPDKPSPEILKKYLVLLRKVVERTAYRSSLLYHLVCFGIHTETYINPMDEASVSEKCEPLVALANDLFDRQLVPNIRKAASVMPSTAKTRLDASLKNQFEQYIFFLLLLFFLAFYLIIDGNSEKKEKIEQQLNNQFVLLYFNVPQFLMEKLMEYFDASSASHPCLLRMRGFEQFTTAELARQSYLLNLREDKSLTDIARDYGYIKNNLDFENFDNPKQHKPMELKLLHLMSGNFLYTSTFSKTLNSGLQSFVANQWRQEKGGIIDEAVNGLFFSYQFNLSSHQRSVLGTFLQQFIAGCRKYSASSLNPLFRASLISKKSLAGRAFTFSLKYASKSVHSFSNIYELATELHESLEDKNQKLAPTLLSSFYEQLAKFPSSAKNPAAFINARKEEFNEICQSYSIVAFNLHQRFTELKCLAEKTPEQEQKKSHARKLSSPGRKKNGGHSLGTRENSSSHTGSYRRIADRTDNITSSRSESDPSEELLGSFEVIPPPSTNKSKASSSNLFKASSESTAPKLARKFSTNQPKKNG